MIRIFLEVEKRGRFHPFYITSIRYQVKIQLEDLVLIVFPFQLKCAEHFDNLAEDISFAMFQCACYLHRNRTCTGGGLHPEDVLEKCSCNSKRVHTRV